MPADSSEPNAESFKSSDSKLASAGHSLDHILGTVASVRVLRELSTGGEHAAPHIAAQTKTSRPAVREALMKLEAAGIVVRVGQGRTVLYRLAPKHPFTKRIVKLFKSEAKQDDKT